MNPVQLLAPLEYVRFPFTLPHTAGRYTEYKKATTVVYDIGRDWARQL